MSDKPTYEELLKKVQKLENKEDLCNQAGEALQRRDEILMAVAFSAEQFLQNPNINISTPDVLERLGEATNVSRVYIFEIHTDNGGLLLSSQRFEWAATGITPQINNPDLQGIPVIEAGFGRWVETFSQNKPLFGIVTDFPDPEQELLKAQGILSIAVVPIFKGSDLWGFIGFDDCVNEQEWTMPEIEVLRAAANILGAAIHRLHVEERLKEKQAQLIQTAKLASLGEMATGISHELKQPLTVMKMYSALMVKDIENEEYDYNRFKSDSLKMQRQVDRAIEIVNNMKNFGRDASLENYKRNDINKIIKEVVDIINIQFKSTEIKLIKELLNELPLINCNANQIEQVLINLLINAKDAIEDVKGIIKISSFQHENFVIVEIEDSGKGIPHEMIEKIFDSFFTTKEVNEGTGLGLPISRSIILEHGGNLEVESKGAKGAIFRIKLPIS